TNQEVKNDNQYLIKEFIQYIKSQSYSKNTEKWYKEYTVKLMGQDEQPIVEITFGGRSIDFDRDLVFDGISIKRGTYEVEEWIEDYLRNYYNGQILNPSFIRLPASLKINDEYTAEDLIDHGSTKINNYDLIPQLTDFFNSNIINKDFNIIDYRVIHSLKDMDLEVESIKSRSRSVSVNTFSDENLLEINSNDGSKGYAKSVCLIVQDMSKPLIYKILTDKMIFNVSVSAKFDKEFNKLFQINASAPHQITPKEIKNLSDSKKKNFMTFISKNLGLKEIELRDDYTFTTKILKLYNNCAVNILTFSDSYNTRLLIYKNNDNIPNSYIGNIDIHSWGDMATYYIKKIGNKTFIVAEKNLGGHGTGVLHYSQDWYLLDDNTVKLALRIPKLDFQVDTYGFNLELNNIKIDQATGLKLFAAYKLSKLYTLNLPITQQSGYVTLNTDINVEFTWDDKQSCFTSKYNFDDDGIYKFISDSKDIRDKCSNVLNKYYSQIEKNINSFLTEKNNRNDGNIRSYLAFLDDCNPSSKRDNLRKILLKIHPD
ncbi:MAG: hypothetical protein Q8942_09420, partial [Bacillota bacterium]|nr:hypothetical protein [Bacillota bacterium]